MRQAAKLSELWCEVDLCGVGPWILEVELEFDAAVLEGPQEARVQANKLLVDMKGSSIKHELQRSSKILKFTDDKFDLETSFFTSMLGAEGAKILEAAVKKLFEISDRQRPRLAEVAQHLENLIKGKLYKFVPEGSQNEMQMFNNVVQGMILGEQPVLKPNAIQVAICLLIIFNTYLKNKHK